MATILIAEDEPRVSSFVRKGLCSNGFSVRVVADGHSAFTHARSGDFDLMVLDTGLPSMGGLSVLRRLRAVGSSLPVVVLTARGVAADVASTLDLRADDCLRKPFRFEDLLTRVRLRLSPERVVEASVLSYGGLDLDLRTRRAHVGDYWVDLSARECALAATFLRHPGQVLPRELLLDQVWGHDYEPGSNVVDVYVRYLRRKLGADRFVTVRGTGYRMGTPR